MGTQIERLELGTHSAEAMVGQMEAENNMLTWILRLVGFVMMAVGLSLAMQPMAVLASVIPFLGSMTRGVITLVAFVLSVSLSLVTIGLAWVAYRPLIGIPLLLLAVGAIVLLVWWWRKRSAAASPVPGPAR
jgi:hypothetical protein